jgi:phage terminase large subunit
MSTLLLAALLSMARGPAAGKPQAFERPASRRAVAAAPPDPQTEDVARAKANIKRWRNDPVAFVREVFRAEPDEWQRDALMAIAKNPRVGMSACKGPGKSCVLAWIAWWFMATNYDAEIVAVSITYDNLMDNLWKELAVWLGKSPMLQATFHLGGEAVTNNDRPNTWWISARAFAKDADPGAQANTLAGIHGASVELLDGTTSANVMVILDEAGDIPPGVLAAAEAIFANKVNAKLVIAGNPTSTDGALYQVVAVEAEKWVVIFITGDPDDQKRSPRIDIDWARAEIAKHGRDNPWVMVNILGLFPPAAADQLIPVNLVLAAMKRDAPALAYRSEAIIWGLDPARFGDDEIALARRQGVVAFRMKGWRNLDGTELGDAVAALLREANEKGEHGGMPDLVCVDRGGVGASAYDRLRTLGWEDVVVGVDFGGQADDPTRYADKRTEMWFRVLEWLKDSPSCLPEDGVLRGELGGPKFEFRIVNKQTVYKLESKKDMKKRGLQSPNRGDALALTFAKAGVMPKSRRHRALEETRMQKVATEYDPLEGF